jgi:peptidoglycan-N-acetylglucosamine deacetylase
MNMSRAEFLKKMGITLAGIGFGASLTRTFAQTLSAPNTTAPVVPLANATPTTPAAPKPLMVSSGPGFGNRLALTFDDGPTPGITERVLAELKKRDLRATFFMIGRNVKAYPDLAKRVYEEGHEICNHSFTHPKLSSLPDDRVREEIVRTQEEIVKATGYRPVWLRPPYGAFHRDRQGYIPQAENLGIVLWSIDPRDWAQPGSQKITDTIITQARPGSIILCHDLHAQTADALPTILDRLLEHEFEFINMSGFLGQPYVTVA